MKKSEFITEHKRLVTVLRTGDQAARIAEANRQARELKEVSAKKKLQKAFKK